ncbi:MAG TPA: tetratricopeptide repeat protein [Mucilaginibacter sp.]
MKIKLLMAGLLGLVTATTFAQKKELNNAQDEYNSYDVAKGTKVAVLAAKATTSLNNAKISIDKASVNEKTASLPLTYALEGAIYGALAYQDSIPATAAPLLTTAQDAIKKAKELDTKGENKKLLNEADTYLALYYSSLGVKQYQTGKYDVAYKSFDAYRQIFPEDTSAVLYTALAAANAGNTDPKFYPVAITNYKTLLTTKYSANDKVYKYLTTLYVISKDTADALKTIGEGVAKYPANTELRELEIRIGLQAGKESEILGKIQAAIANDPKNKTLYYYEGLTYSRIADATDDKASKAKDDATKTALIKTAVENYGKAVDLYKKAVDINPDYFDANLNLGYCLMRPAIDIYNVARNLPANKQKEYEAMRMKADELFDLAKPYLQKAADLDAKSVDALSNLRNYYRGKYDPAHAADNKAKADDLKKQIDALPAAKK